MELSTSRLTEEAKAVKLVKFIDVIWRGYFQDAVAVHFRIGNSMPGPSASNFLLFPHCDKLKIGLTVHLFW